MIQRKAAVSYRSRMVLGAALMLLGSGGSIAVLAGQDATAPKTPAPKSAVVAPGAAEGERLFHESGCSYCHGDNLAGTAKGPSLEKIALKWNTAQMERQIREGGNSMPAFGDVLDSGEVTSLTRYLMLQRGTKVARGR